MTRLFALLLAALVSTTAYGEPMTETQCHEMNGQFVPRDTEINAPVCAFGAFSAVGAWPTALSEGQMTAIFAAYERSEQQACDKRWPCRMLRWLGIKP